jgi:hypothetical protein
MNARQRALAIHEAEKKMKAMQLRQTLGDRASLQGQMATDPELAGLTPQQIHHRARRSTSIVHRSMVRGWLGIQQACRAAAPMFRFRPCR